jgi:4-hydroxy-3-methylbut-2-enyl diphosphate reductase
MVQKVLLASPRGFCAGVVRAIDIVELALEAYDAPLFVRKEIVHNPHVVEDLRQKGVTFVDELDEVPPGNRVIFSAHGVSPAVRDRARRKSLEVIDATCPLVTKVHSEAQRFAAKGYTIVLIGHEGHEEVEGTMGEAVERIVLISSESDVEELEVADPQKVAFLTQTTLSINDTEAIVAALKKKFPAIQGPPTDDICYATQNRQEAVRILAEDADLILVVGARNSSNSNRLVEEARGKGTDAYLINDVGDIKPRWLEAVETVGVTSGASAPDRLVRDVVGFFESSGAQVEELLVREEDVQFALPRNLRHDLEARNISHNQTESAV